jgi:Zn-dependent peptidase ImmA (M78 family)
MDGFNQQVFSAVLSARHLSLSAVSQKIGMAEDDLKSQIRQEKGPSQSVINKLSHELSVPSFVFFMDHAPDLGGALVDFRKSRPSAVPKERETVEAIDMAARLQEIAEELRHKDRLRRDSTLEDIRSPKFASDVRKELRITADLQTGAKSNAAFYSLCRAAIEERGLFVLHDSFPADDGSGFCLADSYARFIVVNTRKQNHGRRNFTLMHELAHALLAKSGISDPFVTKNEIEKACNLFAARVLVPKSLAETAFKRCSVNVEPTLDDIYASSRFLKISQEATVVRFEQLGLTKAGSHRNWLQAIKAIGNPDYDRGGGGGGNVPQEKVKLAKYGFTFAKVFGTALIAEDISPLEIYRASGLKPKYQKPYFSFASSAEPTDAED